MALSSLTWRALSQSYFFSSNAHSKPNEQAFTRVLAQWEASGGVSRVVGSTIEDLKHGAAEVRSVDGRPMVEGGGSGVSRRFSLIIEVGSPTTAAREEFRDAAYTNCERW